MTIRDLFKDEAELAKFQSDIHRDKYGAQKMLLCGTWQNIARDRKSVV